MTEKKTVKLYGGQVKVDFYPNSHQYKIDGQRVPSVTSALSCIAKPGLVYWSANVACQYLINILNNNSSITPQDIEIAHKQHLAKKEEAATSGTMVHEWAEGYIKGAKPTFPEDQEVMNGVSAFLQWVDQHNVKFISSERFVYSLSRNYVGQMDAEAEIDGKLCVIDFKTSKGIYKEMLYQTAAYQKAAEEEGSRYTGGRWIVRFDKETGEFEAKQFDDLESDYNAFLAALTLKKREEELKEL